MSEFESEEFKALTKVMRENFGGIMLPDRPKMDATKIMQKLDELGFRIVPKVRDGEPKDEATA